MTPSRASTATKDEWHRRVWLGTVCLTFLVATIRSFDASYRVPYAVAAVSADNLIYYNMILDAVRHGGSLFGQTLLPSPYFVDLVLQLPLALWTKDFEHFAYDLALSYCGLIYVALFLLCRRNLGAGVITSAAGAFVALATYYRIMPPQLLCHVFIQNHTSELFCSLFAASYALEVARRGGRWVFAYAAFVAFNVASSAFFVATYVLPIIIGMTFLFGTKALRRREVAVFGAATLGAAVVGVGFDAILSATLWPIRGDFYGLTPRQSLSAFVETSYEEVLPFISALLVVTLVAAVLAAVARSRMRTVKDVEPLAQIALLLVFGVTALFTCVSMPIARGAFGGAYEYRYLQEPLLLATLLVAVVVVRGAQRLAHRVPAWR